MIKKPRDLIAGQFLSTYHLPPPLHNLSQRLSDDSSPLCPPSIETPRHRLLPPLSRLSFPPFPPSVLRHIQSLLAISLPLLPFSFKDAIFCSWRGPYCLLLGGIMMRKSVERIAFEIDICSNRGASSDEAAIYNCHCHCCCCNCFFVT